MQWHTLFKHTLFNKIEQKHMHTRSCEESSYFSFWTTLQGIIIHISNAKICLHNAPECSILLDRFQNFPGEDPRTPRLAEGGGPAAHRPARHKCRALLPVAAVGGILPSTFSKQPATLKLIESPVLDTQSSSHELALTNGHMLGTFSWVLLTKTHFFSYMRFLTLNIIINTNIRFRALWGD